jgi:hypothetical protein
VREERNEDVAGPSQVEAKAKNTAKGKGKAKAVGEEGSATTMSPDEVVRREVLARKLVTKKVEVEVLMGEIELIEELLAM